MNSPEDITPFERNERPPQTAFALGAVYLGCLLAVIGGYFYLSGFKPIDSRPIGPQPNAATAFAPQFGTSQTTTPQPASVSTTGSLAESLLTQGSDNTRWIFILGCTLSIWGLWTLRKLNPVTDDPAANYLRTSYAEGVDPASLHEEEGLDEIQRSVTERHQRKVLWSLPFWFTALILLVVNGGTLGNQTALGISDLWLIAITLGVYLLYTYLNWRCPACEALLPKYDERLICDKCGLHLNAKRTNHGPATFSLRKD